MSPASNANPKTSKSPDAKRAAKTLIISSRTPTVGKKLKVTLTRGWAGKRQDMLLVLRGLGLRKRMDSNILPDHKSILGMIAKVSHLVTVEPVE